MEIGFEGADQAALRSESCFAAVRSPRMTAGLNPAQQSGPRRSGVNFLFTNWQQGAGASPIGAGSGLLHGSSLDAVDGRFAAAVRPRQKTAGKSAVPF